MAATSFLVILGSFHEAHVLGTFAGQGKGRGLRFDLAEENWIFLQALVRAEISIFRPF
jgi:hypothetical protein